MDDPDQRSAEETEQRLEKLLRGAFDGPPTPLKAIPKRNRKSRFEALESLKDGGNGTTHGKSCGPLRTICENKVQTELLLPILSFAIPANMAFCMIGGSAWIVP